MPSYRACFRHRFLFYLPVLILVFIGCAVSSGGLKGPVPVTSGIRFQLLYPKAKTVSLVGTFNNWDFTANLLSEKSPGRWSIVMPLPKGRYQYLFVIDQKTWITDPGVIMTIDDGFGQKNSLLVVE